MSLKRPLSVAFSSSATAPSSSTVPPKRLKSDGSALQTGSLSNGFAAAQPTDASMVVQMRQGSAFSALASDEASERQQRLVQWKAHRSSVKSTKEATDRSQHSAAKRLNAERSARQREQSSAKRAKYAALEKRLFGADKSDDKLGALAKASKTSDKELDSMDAFMASLESGTTSTKVAKSKRRRRRKQKRASEIGGDASFCQMAEIRKKKRKVSERIFSEESVFDESDLLVELAGGSLELLRAKRGSAKAVAAVDHSAIDYEPLTKDLYIESPAVARLTDGELSHIMATRLKGCAVTGRSAPRPILEWTQCGLPTAVLRTLRAFSLTRPFPIQCLALPCVMSGRDVLGSAKTGSGKTLAFVLPMVRHIAVRGRGDGPVAVVLAPTRELVSQLAAECRKFSTLLGFRTVALLGGAPVGEQIAALRRGCEVVVGTPGRVIDMLCKNAGRLLTARRVSFVVFDECDRMFDLGFGTQIAEIMKNVRPSRQCVMFSATMPSAMKKAAEQWLTDALHVTVGNLSAVCDDVSQFVRICADENGKFDELLKLLGQWYGKGLILIFSDKRQSADVLYQRLAEAGYEKELLLLHAGVDQMQRADTLHQFRSALKPLLICTSVCARGLDVADLKVVVNYSAPHHYEDYVHRVGRCGRAGNRGVAYTLLLRAKDGRYAVDILKAMKSSEAQTPDALHEMVQEFYESVNVGEAKIYRKRGFAGKGFTFAAEETGGSAPHLGKLLAATRSQVTVQHFSKVKSEEKEKEKESSTFLVLKAAAKAAAAKKSAVACAKTAKSKDLSAAKALLIKARKLKKKKMETEGILQKLERERKVKAKREANARLRKQQKVAEALTQALSTQRPVKAKGDENDDALTGVYSAKVQINDFPEEVRRRVCYRDALNHIRENYAVKVSRRGEVVALGRKAKDDKLHLLVEGESASDVRGAAVEIQRLLQEVATAFIGKDDGGAYAKYSVV